MSRLRDLRELLWPVLEPFTTEEQRKELERFDDDKRKIASLNFKAAGDVALEEARRYADAEDARRRSADQKAATYLAVVAALVPLVLTLATAIWDKKAGPAPTWLNMALLGAAVIYVIGAAYWAFGVLKVATSARIGTMDFNRIWQKPNPSEKLTRQIILCVRSNHAGVNQKVSGIKIAHAYLWRAFLVFSALLLFNILWYLSSSLLAAMAEPEDPWMDTAKTALLADTQVDRLEQQLMLKPAIAVLRERCRMDSRGEDAPFQAKLVISRALSSQSSTRVTLHTTRTEKVNFRAFALWCGNELVADQKIWTRRSPVSQRRGVSDAKARLTSSRGSSHSPRVYRIWPPLNTDVPSRLPDVLLRQYVWTSDAAGQTVELIETSIRRDALGQAPR